MGLKRTALIADPREAVEYQTRKEREREAKTAEKRKVKWLINENERLTRERDAAFLGISPLYHVHSSSVLHLWG